MHQTCDAANGSNGPDHKASDLPPMEEMYEQWFLEYASYVILERAVPAIEDGLKPVQRRILHAMQLIDDGRYNKVANIVGQTMQYHPHGDASITEAIVAIGQKELLIDTQGNWGDLRTGDSAAAARYIEARLAPFSKEILYSPQITTWQLSYDGRKKEPRTLPVKFPLLLAQGVEGIAVGLATKILPHNFIELVEAAIDLLKGKPVSLFPDFATGGLADCTHYNEGKRGGKVRVRARIVAREKQTLAITEIPYAATTTSLIDSILKAHEKGKIKIKNVVDNTAEDIEILVHLLSGQPAETVIDALYLFTDCEGSYAPNACVIQDEKPVFVTVHELLAYAVARTTDLLEQELLLEQQALKEKLFFASLEKIFIENRIYREIEACTTWEELLMTIADHLKPYDFYRPIVEEDLVRLTEIKIKRISQYDSLRAQETLTQLQTHLATTIHHLQHLKDYTIAWYSGLLQKYGKGRERKTILTSFDPIPLHDVMVKHYKLYVNRKQGFIGYRLKGEEFVQACSDIDDIIVIRKDGKYVITKIADKLFVGKDIIYVSVYDKKDTKRYYNVIYVDGATGISFVKRFQVLAITRDKTYDLTLGTPGSRVVYLSAEPNGATETVTILLSPISRTTKKKFEFNFADLSIKGRATRGNILTKHAIYKVQQKGKDGSTLAKVELWYDASTGQIAPRGKGKLLGVLGPTDKILLVFKEGYYLVTTFSFQPIPDRIALIEPLRNTHLLSVVYYNNLQQNYFVKRFMVEMGVLDKKYNLFLSEPHGCILKLVTSSETPKLQLHYLVDATGNDKRSIIYDLEKVAVKTIRAKGALLSKYKITAVDLWNE
ncbi:DNA gyrase/topoisomerase IV subunit A [Cardinium endosymbiont of Oedothorax gibbosus]|uniref:DNA gyrase/topoisomerase IV subunit A n=1 Tax=Cardinium endosymbiont of Oedothorax gibbosus TaxID=931101 RepID=UPI002025088F|nr:DNA gyrase/topoisomerase IV subunit A [Cardinium endosymbiont of Oedothorax gibbosus]CAH2560238.1 DNA topoisomerase, type IIA, domain A-containing protein [Cardinium endosymbiont of Oedothorax gibbosus]